MLLIQVKASQNKDRSAGSTQYLDSIYTVPGQESGWQYPQLPAPDIWSPLESVLREHQRRVSPPASVQLVYCWPLYLKGKTHEPPVTVVQQESWQYPQLLAPDMWLPLESVLREHQGRDSPPASVQLV